MSTSMEVDPRESDESRRVALHPLTIVHMSDQYTRISSGGSPLDKNAPVVGILFGEVETEKGVLQIRDADEIPTEVSDTATVQVDLHRAVFPQHFAVGWYRVSSKDDEPTPSDLQITQQLQQHYASSGSSFVFCLLQVENPEGKPSAATEPASTFQDELPINLYELHAVEGTSILLGLSNWELETSEPERIAVERVMTELPPEAANTNPYVTETKSIQNSLMSLRERIQLLIQFLEQTQAGNLPPNHSLLRQVQSLLYSLGPLSEGSSKASGLHIKTVAQDAELLSHLAAVAKTVNAVESYTHKFRVLHESKSMSKEMRRVF